MDVPMLPFVFIGWAAVLDAMMDDSRPWALFLAVTVVLVATLRDT